MKLERKLEISNNMNFEATEINHLCPLEDSTEPPITMKLSREEIQSYDTHSFEYNVPSHTHSVERNVKLTMSVREQLLELKNVIAARKVIP